MSQTTSVGNNRTGAASSERLSAEMIAGTREFGPSTSGSDRAIAEVRAMYARNAEPVGHVPRPTHAKGKAKMALEGMKGDAPVLFMDKLGERLAFERSGTRLYEAVLSKLDAYGSFDGGPDRAELEDILDEEYAHFRMLASTIEGLGGDPTAVTPSADLQSVMAKGIQDAIVDPRTNLLQSLEAILVAELADNDGWHALEQLAREGGKSELAQQFGQARRTEQEHLTKVRRWVARGQGRRSDGSGEQVVL